MNTLSSEQSDSRLARAGEWTFFQLSSISTPDVHTLGVVLFCPECSLARIARGTFLSRISWISAGYWLLWAATGSIQSGVGAFDPDSPSVPTPRGKDRRDGVRRHVHSDETLGFRGSVERPPLMVDPFTNYKDFCRTQSEADVAVSVRSGWRAASRSRYAAAASARCDGRYEPRHEQGAQELSRDGLRCDECSEF